LGFTFWLKRALKTYPIVFVLLLVIELIKQQTIGSAVLFAATWSGVTTAVFIGSRLYQSRKGIDCALCDDIPSSNSKEK